MILQGDQFGSRSHSCSCAVTSWGNRTSITFPIFLNTIQPRLAASSASSIALLAEQSRSFVYSVVKRASPRAPDRKPSSKEYAAAPGDASALDLVFSLTPAR